MSTPYCELDPTRALPAVSYRDPAWLVAETERIWHGDWVFATTEDALPSPGDQVPIVVGDQPVLLLRNQSGELAAVSNLCAHRGTLLVEEPTNANRIKCPYHAWTYDDAGRLLACPFSPRDAIDKHSHSLPAYRVDSWHGLVFVCLNRNVEPLSERFAAVEPHVVARRLGTLHNLEDLYATETWECNWKIAITNAMESYHLFQVHPTTLEPIAPTRGAYYITGSARATATGGTNPDGEGYLLISLPPGFVGVFSAGSFFWLAVHPVDTQRCVIRIGGVYDKVHHGDAFRRIAAWFTHKAATYAPADFLSEDKTICERVQRGVGGNFRPGKLLPVERVVEDFGHYLNWRINDVKPPQVHTERKP